MSPPARIKAKLIYNNAQKFWSKFINHAEDYARLDSAMKEFPSSEDIVKRLHNLFLDVAEYTQEADIIVGDGDKQLDSIQQQLRSVIMQDQRFSSASFSDEELEQFCIALINHGVSVCEVLLDPEKHATS